MNVFILADLEGVSLADNISMMRPEPADNHPGYDFACERLAVDLNTAVDAAFAGGADTVTVLDGHFCGTNLDNSKLDKRATQIYVKQFTSEPFSKYDALILLGAHAMAGTENAFLDHTQNSTTWYEYKVNGKCYGEIGQDAILAGAFGVPLVAVTGDEAACAEAKTLVPNVYCAAVKKAKGRNNAECLDHDTAQKLIFEAVKNGVENAKNFAPYKETFPAKISVTYTRNDYADAAMENCPNCTRHGRTVEKTEEKLECFPQLHLW